MNICRVFMEYSCVTWADHQITTTTFALITKNVFSNEAGMRDTRRSITYCHLDNVAFVSRNKRVRLENADNLIIPHIKAMNQPVYMTQVTSICSRFTQKKTRRNQFALLCHLRKEMVRVQVTTSSNY